MYQLKYKNQSKGPLWLVETSYSFGSDAGCDVKIDKGVSPKAAVLTIEQGGVFIETLGDVDVVIVNGVSYKGKHQLALGDSFVIGGGEFELTDPKAKSSNLESQPQKKTDWALIALSSALANKRFVIKGTKILGRSKECDISLGVAHLSRKHASLTVTEQGLSVSDLGSSNGTYVNGQKIERAVLRNGDELGFDTLKFRVEGPAENVDSTTVRPVLRTINEAPTLMGQHRPKVPSDGQQRPQQANNQASNKERARRNTANMHKVTSQIQSVDASSHSYIPLIILGVAAVAGLVWFFVFN